MQIKHNGICLQLIHDQNEQLTKIKVLEQSKDATIALIGSKDLVDKQSGLSLKSNRYPSFNRKKQIIYLRGIETDKNNKEIKISQDCFSYNELCEAVERILKKINTREVIKLNSAAESMFINANRKIGGNTTLVRTAFLNKAMASVIQLTFHDDYPTEIVDWKPCKPVVTKNQHYNEHIGQIVDVLNKSVGTKKTDEDIINPHKVSVAAAQRQTQALRKLFQDAYNQSPKDLVALWRLVTGLRGPDFAD